MMMVMLVLMMVIVLMMVMMVMVILMVMMMVHGDVICIVDDKNGPKKFEGSANDMKES